MYTSLGEVIRVARFLRMNLGETAAKDDDAETADSVPESEPAMADA